MTIQRLSCLVALLTTCVLVSLTGCQDPAGGDTGPDGGVSSDAVPSPTTTTTKDGDPCTITGWNCNPDCQASCGISASCTDLCCPETTSPGVYSGGRCVTPPTPQQCGNGSCQSAIGESFATCPADCHCGDGICQVGETSACGDCVVAPATFTVQNNSSRAVHYFYISACTATEWGPNRLTAAINPGGSDGLSSFPQGCWDFLAIDFAQTHRWSSYGNQIVAGLDYTMTLTDANVDPATP
jgi:hypothetical protein